MRYQVVKPTSSSRDHAAHMRLPIIGGTPAGCSGTQFCTYWLANDARGRRRAYKAGLAGIDVGVGWNLGASRDATPRQSKTPLASEHRPTARGDPGMTVWVYRCANRIAGVEHIIDIELHATSVCRQRASRTLPARSITNSGLRGAQMPGAAIRSGRLTVGGYGARTAGLSGACSQSASIVMPERLQPG